MHAQPPSPSSLSPPSPLPVSLEGVRVAHALSPRRNHPPLPRAVTAHELNLKGTFESVLN